MTGNARQFALEIDREFAEQMGDVHQAVAWIGLEAIKRVVMKSPVHTGRFKGNWALSVGMIDTATTVAVDPSGGATISRGQAAIAPYATREDFPMVYIQNNLPYAEPLENGHSKQAPAGMVALTVAELAAIWNTVKI